MDEESGRLRLGCGHTKNALTGTHKETKLCHVSFLKFYHLNVIMVF